MLLRAYRVQILLTSPRRVPPLTQAHVRGSELQHRLSRNRIQLPWTPLTTTLREQPPLITTSESHICTPEGGGEKPFSAKHLKTQMLVMIDSTASKGDHFHFQPRHFFCKIDALLPRDRGFVTHICLTIPQSSQTEFDIRLARVDRPRCLAQRTHTLAR